MSYNNKEVWVDYIRVIATFCVVLLHSAAPLLYKFNELPEGHWWIANVYDSMVRISVPLFFMLSGYLLLEKKERLDIYFKKRINRILVPLLAWSIIFIFWTTYIELSTQLSFKSFYSIALSPAYYHLWFLYAIIGLYLFMPILRVIVENADRKILYYYLALWFIAVSLIPFVEISTKINSEIDLLSISGFSGYLLLGLLLGKYHVTHKAAIASAGILIVSICATIVGTYLLTIRHEGVFYGYFYGYKSPNVVIASIAGFVLLKYLLEQDTILFKPKMLSILRSLSSASLGIYLIHPIFHYLLRERFFGFSLDGFTTNPIISIPATTVATFLLSYLAVVILKQVPLLKRITP